MKLIQKSILFLFSSCLLTSCYTSRMMNEFNADKNMQSIKIGMTKSEIISTMGDTYKVMEAKQSQDGYAEVLGYVDAKEGIYRLRLKDNKLTEWDYILPPAHHKYESTSTTNQ